ncbi:lysoplasmalogenase [Flavobacteriaceae bacterium]|nr:lysoplasmalogenase [Flavobacteriaceae bacterium]
MILSIPNRIKFSLFSFVLSSVCYIYGSLFGNVTLEITSTIFLIPSLTFLYFLKSKEKNLAYGLILVFSWIGGLLILSKTFLNSISGVIAFWGVILLLTDHILKRLKTPLKKQFKKKKTIYSFLIHSAYLGSILYLLSEHLGSFIYPISFYGICLVGTSFLSTVLWNEQKNKANMILMFGIIMLVISGSILAIKLFEGEITQIQDFFRLFLYVISELFICLYFITSKKSE